MDSGSSSTFKELYCSNAAPGKIARILEAVFVNQLGQLYKAARFERCNLFEHYSFLPKYAGSVQQEIDDLYGKESPGKILTLPNNKEFPNPVPFYKEQLPIYLDAADKRGRTAVGYSYFSFIHGDLNGANIIIDGQENVWLIDFFHTQLGHVLRDLIKLENDLLYIFTPVTSIDDLDEAVKLTDLLLN
ncbi:MAG: phosphotransferase, partial [bacterium]|nr:phosphotransferase [bacterium]